ncbi:acetolactate synthase [bacterium]|nr:acetolactate synthase [bacterium]
MLLHRLALLGLILPSPALCADGIDLPSGQHVTLIEVLNNVPGSDGLAIRYRFLAPQIARDGGTIDGETAGHDMDWLCNTYVLPRLPTNGPQPNEIIISMSDKDVPFGEDHPEATQFFNSYAITDGACEWEMY